MGRYVARRLLQGLVTLWAIVTVSFALMRVAPGGPFDKEKPLPPAVVANLKRTYGLAADVRSEVAGTLVRHHVQAGQPVARGQALAELRTPAGLHTPAGLFTQRADRDLTVVQPVGEPGRPVQPGEPLLVRDTTLAEQYLTALGSYARLDLGVTYASEGARTVTETLAQSFPVSLELGLLALVLALALGVSIGLLAGLYRNSWIDHVAMTGALAAVSMSSIILGPLLILVFGVTLRWLPWGGWEPLSWRWEHAQVKILPILTLALIYAAWFARLARAGLLEVLHQGFIRTARAKGLSEWQVVTRHALRGALLPVVSFLGPALAGIVTGSVVVERVFTVPGVGEYFVTAAVNRDYPLVMGTVVLYSSILIVANLAVDVAYAALDPRVRRDHG